MSENSKLYRNKFVLIKLTRTIEGDMHTHSPLKLFTFPKYLKTHNQFTSHHVLGYSAFQNFDFTVYDFTTQLAFPFLFDLS